MHGPSTPLAGQDALTAVIAAEAGAAGMASPTAAPTASIPIPLPPNAFHFIAVVSPCLTQAGSPRTSAA
ncbi:hypothetical protein GCM10027167_23070 [Nocardia heshunensis]